MGHSLGLSLASWEDKGHVDLPSQSTTSRPLQCGFSGERHSLHELRKQIKIPQIICRGDPQEAQVALFDLTIGKGPYKGIIDNQEIKKVGISETHASGNREASTHNEGWKANWWNKYWWETSRWTRNDEVWELKKGSDPRRRIEEFLSRRSWSDECWFFFLTEFSRHSFSGFVHMQEQLQCAVYIPCRPKWLQIQIGNKIENNWPVSDYRRYRFILNRKQ